MTPARRVLWAANVRTKSLAERLRAATAGGFTSMSMFPVDYRAMIAAGRTPAEIGREIRASGVTVHVCDPFVQWVPGFEIPSGYPADYAAFVDHDEEAVMAMADAVGATTVNCVEPFGVRHPTAALTDALGAFAERARRRGLRVTLEFMPISGIVDLRSAWEIVRDLPGHVGLTFDTWHFHRSDPDRSVLAEVPTSRIFEVQLADAKTEIHPAGLTEDLLHHRMLPGEGELDLRTTLDALRVADCESVGPELFSDVMDALSAEEVGRVTGENLRRWLP